MKDYSTEINSNNGKIYILYYKNGTILPLDELYEPLFCGEYVGKTELNYTKDNTGVNISAKNEFYSELTGIYWVWKNKAINQEIIGFCHYRRYFTLHPEPWYHELEYFLTHPFKKKKGPNPLIYTNKVRKWAAKVLTAEEAKLFLDDFDVILPLPRKFKYSVRTHYRKYHDIKDLELVTKILSEIYPEMLKSWDAVLDGNELYGNNMFIIRPCYFDEFMHFWFKILFEFEARVTLEDYIGYQRRILGFLAERLLTLWVKHKELKIKQLQLIYFKNLKRE